jgi:hypothetical protein
MSHHLFTSSVSVRLRVSVTVREEGSNLQLPFRSISIHFWMGFRQFYRTRLSPIVTIAALFIGIHISWWAIQQKLVPRSSPWASSLFRSSPALVPSSERRRDIIGIRVPYLSPPVGDQEKKSEWRHPSQQPPQDTIHSTLNHWKSELDESLHPLEVLFP